MLTIPIEVTNQHHHQVAAERKQQQNAAAAAAANEDLSDTNDGPITAVSRRGNASTVLRRPAPAGRASTGSSGSAALVSAAGGAGNEGRSTSVRTTTSTSSGQSQQGLALTRGPAVGGPRGTVRRYPEDDSDDSCCSDRKHSSAERFVDCSH